MPSHDGPVPRRDRNGGSTSTLTGDGGGGDSSSQAGGGGAADDTLESLTTPVTPLGIGGLVQPTEVTVQKINASSAIVSKTGETLTSPHELLKSKVNYILSQPLCTHTLCLPISCTFLSATEYHSDTDYNSRRLGVVVVVVVVVHTL